jgi:hypothetical protein
VRRRYSKKSRLCFGRGTLGQPQLPERHVEDALDGLLRGVKDVQQTLVCRVHRGLIHESRGHNIRERLPEIARHQHDGEVLYFSRLDERKDLKDLI